MIWAAQDQWFGGKFLRFGLCDFKYVIRDLRSGALRFLMLRVRPTQALSVVPVKASVFFSAAQSCRKSKYPWMLPFSPSMSYHGCHWCARINAHASAHKINFLRAACLQNETAPDKFLDRYEKRFEKTRKGIRKTIRNAFEKFLAPLRPLNNISPALFTKF